MPSRNSVNKPKVKARKPYRPNSRKSEPILTTKAITKKRAKKLERNARYREEYMRSVSGNDTPASEMDMDIVPVSKTQLKKQLREQRNQSLLLQHAESEKSGAVITGQGTTLGGPPTAFVQ